jgi:hypothetical protein
MEFYNKYSDYLKTKYGERVHRISVDAGFSCPNKTLAENGCLTGGCIYCNDVSFNFSRGKRLDFDLEKQIENRIKHVKSRFHANKFVLYFQNNTNTFAPVDVLKKKYDVIYKFKDFVGLNIATRPDAVDDKILDLIESYSDSENYEVWIEYGLQSIHDKTLDLMNRGHNYQDFINAIELTKKRKNIKICAHVILGLPNENEEMILATAKAINNLPIDGLKLHPMHIVKNTKLAEVYKNFEFNFLNLDEYIEILAKFLGNIRPDVVIHGLRGYCPSSVLITPFWLADKEKVIKELEQYLKLNSLKQSSLIKKF